MEKSRPDQVRDRDAIQRHGIGSSISTDVVVKVSRRIDGPRVILYLCEPDTSENRGQAKFSFIFENVDDLRIFMDKMVEATAHPGDP